MTEAAVERRADPGNANRKPTARKDMTRMQWTLHQMKVNKIGYIFIAPFFIIFLVFIAFPVLLSMILSFTSFNGLEFPKFLFLNNYINLLVDDDMFMQSFQNTLVFAAVTGPVSYLASLLLAWFINELSPRVRAFITVLFYAPTIAGNMYIVFQLFFSADQYGYANQMLMYLHVIAAPVNWFGNAAYAGGLIIFVALWTSLGTAFLSFIAGFKAVDRTLFEAGSVDEHQTAVRERADNTTVFSARNPISSWCRWSRSMRMSGT